MDNKILPYALIIAVLLYTLIRPKKFPAIKLYQRGFFCLGFATGFLGVLIGVIGPLISPFFLRDDLSSHEVVANKSFLQTSVHLAKLPVFIYLGFSYIEYALPLIFFILSGMLGTVVGLKLLSKFSKKTFDNIFKIFLFLVTIKMSYSLYLLL